MRLVWADGLFRAERELEDDDPTLAGLKAKVESAVRNAWDFGQPYTVQRGHKRNVYVKLTRDLGDVDKPALRQAIRELLETGRIGSARNGKLGGLKCFD